MEGGNKSVLSALSDKFSALKDYIIRKKWWSVALLAISAAYYLCLPQELFNDQYSPVLLARNGELLSASIAADGQWRFPKSDTISDKFVEALIAFEDKRFRDHPGVDVFSIGRAISQNISKRKVVSGASTISMQVIRLSRKGNSRTLYEKLLEIVLATRLELRYSKNEILSLYAAHAPFGGNVVGLEAACWRYFGNSSKELSWAEAALLAVLPNAPALIHPGRNRAELKAKRDRLLDKLVLFGKIDELSCALAKEEPVPEIPFALPQHARHLLVRGVKDGHINKKITSTVDFALQHRTEQIVQDHHDRLKSNRIYNIAALVIDVQTGEVLSYVGNAGFDKKHGNDVDVITAARSTGSILKPFLYAAMLDDGKMFLQYICCVIIAMKDFMTY
jgi:penicillin-binding protein 1C